MLPHTRYFIPALWKKAPLPDAVEKSVSAGSKRVTERSLIFDLSYEGRQACPRNMEGLARSLTALDPNAHDFNGLSVLNHALTHGADPER